MPQGGGLGTTPDSSDRTVSLRDTEGTQWIDKNMVRVPTLVNTRRSVVEVVLSLGPPSTHRSLPCPGRPRLGPSEGVTNGQPKQEPRFPGQWGKRSRSGPEVDGTVGRGRRPAVRFPVAMGELPDSTRTKRPKRRSGCQKRLVGRALHGRTIDPGITD